MAKQNTVLSVEGMSCMHCVNSVKRAVSALNGVSAVEIDLKGGKVSVEYDDKLVSIDAVKDAISDQGYDVV